ncbi:hypothetical protein EB001_17570 [bacterium]|jgi:RNA polymerase sigma factor (sigma-70 family)|nr:hypothetical protein [bacterium]
MDIAEKIKVPSNVYDRNAHRRFLRQQKREQERLERERIEREETERRIRDYCNRRNSSFNLLMTMHELDQKVVCKRAIESLEPRLRFVAVRRFYQNQTLRSIGEELGISGNRVLQLEAKLLRILKEAFMRGKM